MLIKRSWNYLGTDFGLARRTSPSCLIFAIAQCYQELMTRFGFLRFTLQLCFFTGILFSAARARAFEYLSLISKDCKVHSGFLTGDENGLLSLLNAESTLDRIPVTDVDQIVVHDLLQFPFSLNKLGTEVDWYQVTLLDSHHSVFRGTPVQFVDQLVFFLNDKGTIEVTSFQQIADLKKLTDKQVTWIGKPAALDFTAARVRCPQLSEKGVIPSRILNDPIQIDEFLRNFETGFSRFQQLNERMFFYARPMLVKDTVRMGFLVSPKAAEAFDPPLFNFKFSSGVPFGLQSATEIGSFQNDWIPFFFPTTSASFEIKSHLFHAVLVAHLNSISGGSSSFGAYTRQATLQPPSSFYYDEKAPFVLSNSFNYLTMFGIDILHWTTSIGGYFPVQYIYANGETREMLATAPQLVGRVMYTANKWRVRLDGAKYDLTHSTEGKNPSLNAFAVYDKLTGIVGKTTGYFLRAGFDWDFAQSMQAKFDVLQNHWSYTETSDSGAQSSENTYAVSVSKEFGRYVSMKAYVSYVSYAWDGNFNGVTYSAPLREQTTGGEFEFLF